MGKDAFIDALGVQEIGGEVFLVAEEGVAQVSGWIDAKGGEVRLLGEQLYLLNKARVDVSGETGGGTILVGGDFQGKNPDIVNGEYTYIDPGASLSANAVSQGNGGKIIAWAEKGLIVHGSLSAKGGEAGGDGGFVEVSSHGGMDFGWRVDVSAANGQGGHLFLDPTDVVFSSMGPFTLVTFMDSPPTSWAMLTNPGTIDTVALSTL